MEISQNKTQESTLVLHQNAIAAARAEKAATYHLLECLFKIDRRRGFLELGYPSLFDYIQAGLGYSSSQAYERMSAMRLAFRVAEVGERLKSGDLTLTAVAKLSSHAKRENLPAQKIVALTQEVSRKSIREVERVLAQNAVTPVPPRETVRPVSASAAELRITIDHEFEALLKEAKELEADPTLSLAEVLKRALRLHVARRRQQKRGELGRVTTERRRPQREMLTESASESGSKSESRKNSKIKSNWVQAELQHCLPTKSKNESGKIPDTGIFTTSATSNPRYISRAARRVVWQRAEGRCQYTSPLTHQRCNAKQSLEIDHRIAVARNGTNASTNLQLLCRSHNAQKGAG